MYTDVNVTIDNIDSSTLLIFIFKNIITHKVNLNSIYILQGFPQPSIDEAVNYQLPLQKN